MQRPKVAKKKAVIERKIERQKARSEEAANHLEEQKANGSRWEELSNDTKIDEIELSQRDPLQQSMFDFAVSMGIATEGGRKLNELSNEFGHWGRTLSNYIQEKCASIALKDAHEAAPVPGSTVAPHSSHPRPNPEQRRIFPAECPWWSVPCGFGPMWSTPCGDRDTSPPT